MTTYRRLERIYEASYAALNWPSKTFDSKDLQSNMANDTLNNVNSVLKKLSKELDIHVDITQSKKAGSTDNEKQYKKKIQDLQVKCQKLSSQLKKQKENNTEHSTQDCFKVSRLW